MHRCLALAFSAATLVLPLRLAAAAHDSHPGRFLAANCTGCHGTQGYSVGSIPRIAGLDRAAIIGAMKAFRAGERPATVMHQHAKGYTDAQVELIADYFAAQPPL